MTRKHSDWKKRISIVVLARAVAAAFVAAAVPIPILARMTAAAMPVMLDLHRPVAASVAVVMTMTWMKSRMPAMRPRKNFRSRKGFRL